MNKDKYKQVALDYINFLEAGDISAVVALFSKKGIVKSPIYGKMKAADFYKTLAADTTTSKLTLKGIFTEDGQARAALYFEYQWLLEGGEKVVFDVVDIIVFNEVQEIAELQIIYDTVHSREAVANLRK